MVLLKFEFVTTAVINSVDCPVAKLLLSFAKIKNLIPVLAKNLIPVPARKDCSFVIALPW